jgi:hypothetical protein
VTDSVQVIWEYLTVSGTDLHALIALRAWSPEAPATFKNEQAAVVYELLDEEQRALPNNTAIVKFLCFGGKRADGKDFLHKDARAVYRALHDRLMAADGVSTASGTILVCTLESAGQDYGLDETEWPVVESQYRITIE